MDASTVLRYTAFSHSPTGGNPAGVVLDAAGMDDRAMLTVAADVGYSETAFVFPAPDPSPAGPHTAQIRYFSPRAEVPFCGHATIATAVAHAERHGPGVLQLHTRAGTVKVTTRIERGRPLATLTSVPPHVSPVSESDLAEALAALRWSPTDLDPLLPPRVAYAGAHHLVLAAQTRARLADLDYDFPRLQALCQRCDWTTVHLVHRAAPDLFDARDPFPAGGVYEDPATGAAAAALGAYLPSVNALQPPAHLTVRQGHDMGRPSTLLVDIPASLDHGISVTGAAVSLLP